MTNNAPGSATVNVYMITYNHEGSIADAIEGVLMQEADFDFKLIIGEDCSTDGTRRICETYAARYPGKVQVLETPENLGIQKNCFRTLEVCLDAPYIAICEGDDKWTDKNKLAHQVEFLESHREFVAHAHNVLVRDLRDSTERHFGQTVDKGLTPSELINTWPFHDVSLMVRSSAVASIPVEDLPYFVSCDRFINWWIACTGSVYYEGTKCMAVYHRHTHGVSGTDNFTVIREQDLRMLEFLKPYFPDATLYKQRRATAIESLFISVVRENRTTEVGRIASALEYMSCVSLMKPHTFYIVLLILVGRPFFKLHKCLKDILGRSERSMVANR